VLETLSGRGTLFEIFRRDEAVRRLDAVLSECSRNLKIMNFVVKRARNNQKDPEKREFTTERFGLSAVELLITNRYVDEDQSFFELAEEYSNRFNSLNSQVNIWEYSPNATEQWLLKYAKRMAKLIEECKAKMMTAREKVSKRF